MRIRCNRRCAMINMYVGAAYSRGFHLNQYIVMSFDLWRSNIKHTQ
jgi:hypothetical protein